MLPKCFYTVAGKKEIEKERGRKRGRERVSTNCPRFCFAKFAYRTAHLTMRSACASDAIRMRDGYKKKTIGLAPDIPRVVYHRQVTNNALKRDTAD